MPQRIDFLPNGVSYYTAEQAEAQLKDFTFKGPGWYPALDGQSAILVIPDSDDLVYTGSWRDPVEKSPWRQRWPKEQLFAFYIYDSRPFNAFNAIVNAPSRI